MTIREELFRPFDGRDKVVEMRGVTKRYGRKRALDAMNCGVPEGAVFLLVGPNGAGKTTTIKALLDTVRPQEGTITVFGMDPRADGDRVRAAIGHIPEDGVAPHGWMRVEHMIRHHARHYPNWDDAYARTLIAALEVDVQYKFGGLSKGQTRRVQLVMALAHRPRLLLFDEPTDGLDPLIRDRFFSMLADHLAATPTTVMVSSHLVHENELLTDHLGVMQHGKVVAQLDRDTMAARLKRYDVEAPAEWSGGGGVDVLRRREHGGERQWTIWGEEGAVTESLRNTGATVRAVTPLTLSESVTVLMELGSAQ